MWATFHLVQARLLAVRFRQIRLLAVVSGKLDDHGISAGLVHIRTSFKGRK
jgi:hypothetical protein